MSLEQIQLPPPASIATVFAPTNRRWTRIVRRLPQLPWIRLNEPGELIVWARRSAASLSVLAAPPDSAEAICRTTIDTVAARGQHAVIVVLDQPATRLRWAFRAAGACLVCGEAELGPRLSALIGHHWNQMPTGPASLEQRIIRGLPWRPIRLGRVIVPA